jgi:hypothetical protein
MIVAADDTPAISPTAMNANANQRTLVDVSLGIKTKLP